MKLRWLIALGVGAYLLFAILTVPASVLLGGFRSTGITAAGVEGTAWKGRAQMVQFQGVPIGRVEWDLHALALFTLRLQADVTVARTEGFAQSVLQLRPSGVLTIRDLTASLPLAALANLAPKGWSGTVNLKFSELVLEEGWPSAAIGTADILNIEAAGRSPISGSYRLTFPAPNAQPSEDTLVGALTDLEGPLQVVGQLELRKDRSYLLQGLVAARPDAPPAFAKQLQILGPPDQQGRRQFSLEGTL